MDEELALLRAIVANPFDRTVLGAYADWLAEHGRVDEEATIRKHTQAIAPSVNGNSISVGELIGHLLTMPPDAPVIYRACSDWQELQKDEVFLALAEEEKINYRPQNGYMDYKPEWFALSQDDAQRMRQRHGAMADRWYPQPNEQPRFVTVCCFPGN